MKTFLDFRNELSKGKTRNVYFISASDNYFIDKASSILREKLFGDKDNKENYFLRYSDDTSLAELTELSGNFASLFSQVKLIVLKKCEKYSRKIDELLSIASRPDPDSVMMLCFDRDYVLEKKLDKNGEFFDFSELSEKDVYEWIRSEFALYGRKLTDDAMQYLASSMGGNFEILHKEIEKISCYEPDSQETIDKALVLKFTGFEQEFTPNDLMKSILRNDSVRSVQILDNLINKAGLNEIYLVSIISNYYFDLLSFKSGKFAAGDNYSLYGKYKMWGERMNFAKQYHNLIDIKDLERAIALLIDLDKNMKTSMIDSKVMLTSVVKELSSM